MGRSQFEDALLMHKPIILGWLSDFNTQLSLGRHELGGGMHYGQLSDLQGPQFLKLDGSRALTGNLAVSAGVTIDGVDIGAHAADANAHHVAASIQDSTTIDFTITGQTISGSVIQSALDHGSIGGLGDDDHTQYYNSTRLQAANLTWSGNHVFQGGLNTRHITPELNDTYDLGTNVLLWRKGWLSELDTILFAQNTVTLLGGWFMISKGEGVLVGDVLAADTQINFGTSMTVNDFVLLRTSLKVE